MSDFLIWGGASIFLVALKLGGIIDWSWPLVAAPVLVPIVVWIGIVIAAVIAWPFRRWAGARNSSSGRD